MNGLLSIPAAEYHADPADVPSLSSSIAYMLCESTPAHARAAHPRLNPDFERTEEEKFDVGTVAHAMLLEGRDIVEVVYADDWRTKIAKEARAIARLDGKIPLLAKHFDQVKTMVEILREQLAEKNCRPALLVDGKPEQTLIWEDEGVTCRALFDWLHDDLSAVDDLKTTVRTANPNPWTRQTLFSIGADIQVAFYLRGLEVAFGATDVEWRFIVAETSPPFAVSVVSLGPDVLMLARKKVRYALKLWRRCMETGIWPGYPNEICWAELPPWIENQWLAKEAQEAA